MPLAQQDYLKLVVRNLPSSLPSDSFIEVCTKEFGDRIKWSSFTSGKDSAKTKRSGTGYVKLGNQADVLDFKTAFEGRQFSGQESKFPPVSVEYAPLQRVPGPKVKRDPRQGTIEQDAAYREFCEALDRGADLLPSAALLPEPTQEEGKRPAVITPLMAHLAETTVLETKQPKVAGRAGKSKQQQLPPPATSESVQTKPYKSRSAPSQPQGGAVTLPAPSRRGKGSKQGASVAAAATGAGIHTGAHKKGLPQDRVEATIPLNAGRGATLLVPTKKSRAAPKATAAAAVTSRPEGSPSRADSPAAVKPPSSATVDGRTAGLAARAAARNALSAVAASKDRTTAASCQSPSAKATAVPAAAETSHDGKISKGREKSKTREKRVRPGFDAWQRSRPAAEKSRAASPT